MSELFKFPIKVEESSVDDLNVIDRDGNVVVKLNWTSDQNHIRRQREVGTEIVRALTDFFSSPNPAADNFCAADSSLPSEKENLELVYGKSVPQIIEEGLKEKMGYTDKVRLKRLRAKMETADRRFYKFLNGLKEKYA